MSVQETPPEPVQMRGGPPPDHLRIENMVDVEKIRALLHRTLNLSDEAFEDIVNDVGYRAALLVLRAQALSGNIKALELYFRVVAESRARRSKREALPAPSSENDAFLVRPRRPRASKAPSASKADPQETQEASAPSAGDVEAV